MIIFTHGAEEHLGHFDPIRATGRAQQGLEVAAATVLRRALVHALGIRLSEDARGHIAVEETHPFKQEATRVVHALLVRAPVLQTVITAIINKKKVMRNTSINKKKCKNH